LRAPGYNPEVDRRALPSVHDVYTRLERRVAAYPRELVVEEIRRAIARRRESESAGSIDEDVLAALHRLTRPTLRRVINATGVILHTNLGRAPLGPVAIEPGYTNLEYDLATGRRGKRDDHISGLLQRILGTSAIAVNNGAAAVFLVLNELASGYEAIVSRGEMIEIGDGFRIPEIMARSGAILREVGTTNRTTLDDYRQAINERTRILLRVHRSNFEMTGFTARPSLKELTTLGVPVYEDLGSGCLIDLKPYGIIEPLATDSLNAGVDLVSFSGDKLLGGPQAGIIAGKPELVERIRRNPLYRALRLDKTSVQILSETLRRLVLADYDAIPALRMLRATPDAIRRRAVRLAADIPGITIEAGESLAGGGATPEQPLTTYLMLIDADIERELRESDPPVIARIIGGRVALDLRTVQEEDEPALMRVLGKCLQRY